MTYGSALETFGDPWAIHGTHGSPMGLTLVHIADPWVAHEPRIGLGCWRMGRPRFTHGSPMGLQCWPMVCPLVTHGLQYWPMGLLVVIYT